MNNVSEVLKYDLIYTVDPRKLDKEQFMKLASEHPEIKFVSLVGIDLAGNDTDEKIPIGAFGEDMDDFLDGAVQTDGSSVVLYGIATLNNGKIDLVADKSVKWFVDYNYENIDPVIQKPVGTLRIPASLVHDGRAVDSRSVLRRASQRFEKIILNLFKKNKYVQDYYGIKGEEIAEVILTTATELEFWVKTPNEEADVHALSTSQVLQEQYWKRTRGVVRTALEESILAMERYGFEPEMGHKEVGGVRAKLDDAGNLNHVMEQLEIDWKYSTSMQAIDNERFIRILIKEIFRRHGLDVSFEAKPIAGVAGSGKHVHIGVSLKLKSGKRVNLFTAKDPEKEYISPLAYGSVMGLMKNYEIIAPFVSSTIDSLERLKPGFEAPVCVVSSLGHSIEQPSRNRTVLVGLVRDKNNPLATRFELRSPNPKTNTYLTLAAIYQTMVDGIHAVVRERPTTEALVREFSKSADEEGFYLEKGREYRSEKNVFEEYTEEERNRLFGMPPKTVYEAMDNFERYPEKTKILKEDGVIDDAILNSCATAATQRCTYEILNRLLPQYMHRVRSCKSLHQIQLAQDLDISNWSRITTLRNALMKDTYERKSYFTQIREAAATDSQEELSRLQLETKKKIEELTKLYEIYTQNLIDIEE